MVCGSLTLLVLFASVWSLIAATKNKIFIIFIFEMCLKKLFSLRKSKLVNMYISESSNVPDHEALIQRLYGSDNDQTVLFSLGVLKIPDHSHHKI